MLRRHVALSASGFRTSAGLTSAALPDDAGALTNPTATNHTAEGVISQVRFSQAIAIPVTAAAADDQRPRAGGDADGGKWGSGPANLTG